MFLISYKDHQAGFLTASAEDLRQYAEGLLVTRLSKNSDLLGISKLWDNLRVSDLRASFPLDAVGEKVPISDYLDLTIIGNTWRVELKEDLLCIFCQEEYGEKDTGGSICESCRIESMLDLELGICPACGEDTIQLKAHDYCLECDTLFPFDLPL